MQCLRIDKAETVTNPSLKTRESCTRGFFALRMNCQGCKSCGMIEKISDTDSMIVEEENEYG